ncbi:MAG: hypothetical protein MUF15_03215 [Acidobacteria bacterium]|jgi:hypothetical protein|nr:hypothetical protein [Acidobacteriota bacterium]
MSCEEKHKPYIILQQANIRSMAELRDYDYFIVHHVSEFRVYQKQDFLARYHNFDQIFNLYCIKPDEELRFNNGHWLKIFESQEITGNMEGFKIETRETKEYELIGSNENYRPLLVYKYYYFTGPVTVYLDADGVNGANREFCNNNDIQILYRHGLPKTVQPIQKER